MTDTSSSIDWSLRARARVLVVGMGGIGCPLALVLARAGIGTLGLVDDDLVERTNLHRQILFQADDVGAHKLDAARRGLARHAEAQPHLELHRERFVPSNAVALATQYDLVLEGADNFSTKFLVADACAVAQRPVVHGAAVRTMGTVLSVAARGRPCYRCVFEDLPREDAPNCADAGVIGPLVGLVAAIQADLALAIIDGRARFGEIVHVDATPRVRRRNLAARASCPSCGAGARPAVDPARYVPQACAS